MDMCGTPTIFNVPTHVGICVGNIYIGGTGKTPLSILIGKELVKNGKKLYIAEVVVNSNFADSVALNIN